jgi:asparagine synthase (glutamine-hydrolysing)
MSGWIDRAGQMYGHGGSSSGTACTGCRVMVRGFIGNRMELRARFDASVVVPGADEHLIAHAYQAWGGELSGKVLGEFVAVVADPAEHVGLLTHDSLGLAPLFYAERDGELHFSSHLARLVRSTDTAELDEEYLADYLSRGIYSTERTPYRGIKRLLPGQSAVWANGRLRLVTNWNLADMPPHRCRDDAEYEEQFRALLTEGVRNSVETSGTLWSDVSGGLDSSSVTSMAATLGATLAAYSVVCPGFPESDERRWMRAVVEQYDLPWHQLDVETALPFTALPGDDFIGEPTTSVVDGEQLRLKRELFAAHGVTTVLTGHGGDSALGGFPGNIAIHLADVLFEGRPLSLLQGVREWQRDSKEHRSHGFWLLRSVMGPVVNHVRGYAPQSMVSLPPQPWLEPAYARSMRLEHRLKQRLAPVCRQPGRQDVWDKLWVGSLAMSAITQRRQDYDVRSPLLYRPLVEFMCAIPWEQKLRPRCDRYLQRRALKGILPELVRRRASKAIGSRALIEGLRRSRQWVEYLMDESLMAERGIATLDGWRQAVRQAALGQTHGDQFFMAGVAVEVWLRQMREHGRETTTATSAGRVLVE